LLPAERAVRRRRRSGPHGGGRPQRRIHGGGAPVPDARGSDLLTDPHHDSVVRRRDALARLMVSARLRLAARNLLSLSRPTGHGMRRAGKPEAKTTAPPATWVAQP